uniref:Uncharacterized protein n=1 Tax=Anguilla anguilla TaxID=7936 RepID=A0A0E9PDW8_ANGAN
MNNDILKAIKARNTLFLEYRKTREEHFFSESKQLRNKINRKIEKAKKEYFN